MVTTQNTMPKTPKKPPKISWAEKLNIPTPSEVKVLPVNIAGMKAGQIMLIPNPKTVDDFIRSLPKGTCMSVKAMRQQLATQFQAEVTCPIVTGFHLRTVAEAAFEAFKRGVPLNEITPIWRVLDAQSTTLKKLSFDPEFILQQRKKEGLQVANLS